MDGLLTKIALVITPETDARDPSNGSEGTRKEIVPVFMGSEPLWAPHNHTDYVESIGERVDFALKAGKINSFDLRVEIRTSDGHQAETTFDLARLK